MSVTIQRISPEVIAEIVAVHRKAFAGYMNTKLGRAYLCAFFDWFRKDESAIALVALVDGKVGGYAVGAPYGYQDRMSRDLFGSALTATLIRPWNFFDSRFRARIRKRLEGLISQVPAEDGEPIPPRPFAELVAIGVSPDLRGKHISDMLMESFESEARLQGMKSLRLTVYKDNAPARRFYERCGWLAWPTPGGEFIYYYLKFPPESP